MKKIPLGEMQKEQVIANKLDFMTMVEFVKKYHPGLRPETVAHWMCNSKIHWFKPGRERFVVLTPETMAMKPAPYKDRK